MTLRNLFDKAYKIEERVKESGTATERDVAQIQEVCNQVLDELERLENTATVQPFLSADTVADAVLKWWYPDEQHI